MTLVALLIALLLGGSAQATSALPAAPVVQPLDTAGGMPGGLPPSDASDSSGGAQPLDTAGGMPGGLPPSDGGAGGD